MQLKHLLDSPCRLRYMIENLDVHSGFSRRILLDSEMMTEAMEIENNYNILKAFHNVVMEKQNRIAIQTLQSKLCRLKGIPSTIGRLAGREILDDIELFEIKHLALLSSEIRQSMVALGLETVITIPDLEEVVKILDPDGMRIATFLIYDSYSSELKKLRDQLKNSEVFLEDIFIKASAIEDEIREDLSLKISAFTTDIDEAQQALAGIDIFLAKAQQMEALGLCFPSIAHDKQTSYEGLFHPEVKSILQQNNKDYQPIDIRFEQKPTIIIGANMGGKTVVIKTLALCQYLFQFGFGIPALAAKIMIQSDVYCTTTDEQSIDRGLSSFAAEMKNIDAIIKKARESSNILALIDEPAKTTNPVEGTALVSALVKILQDKSISLILVTHYNINSYHNRCLRVKGLENGKMNYALVEAHEGEVPHEALNIAESIGIDPEWITNAQEILNN